MSRLSFHERFWSKVSFPAGGRGCWLWTGAIGHGYGQIRLNQRTASAYAVSYAMHHGSYPMKYDIDHRCRNRACVNPAHLEAVPKVENILRGMSDSAMNTRKIRCWRGHLFDHDRPGGRGCSQCLAIWWEEEGKERHRQRSIEYRRKAKEATALCPKHPQTQGAT